ncbi:hypothetical protein B0T18DRAFT_425950 [Schizothecium vesticola]|uniref:AA1-like domain-containing protein n=1 Tax=Schizothecium vesticola TaxID=314040 RepID=A0AA40F4U5_9PEZI|nr:hypothetical protein B0T18DRAFT_425950 [Schizothecium vesticola]
MRPILSQLLVMWSAITAAHASNQPAYSIRDFDPATYNHTQGNQFSGYPNITNFIVQLEGGGEWNTISTYNISFSTTFVDTTNPVVTTHCITLGRVFNPGYLDTDFGGGVLARSIFDFSLNEDRSADLLVMWKPWGGEWKQPACWRELNVTRHIPADEILGPIPMECKF